MTIKKENQAQTGKFMDFLPGEVFSYENEFYMKLSPSPDCENRAASLVDGGVTLFNGSSIVEKVFCTLNVK